MFSKDSKAAKPTKLTDTEIQAALKTVPGWELNAEQTMISRKVLSKKYRTLLSVVASVGEIAEQEKHHPDVQFGYGYCNIQFTTHDVKGLTAKDFACAVKINNLELLVPKVDAAPASAAAKPSN